MAREGFVLGQRAQETFLSLTSRAYIRAAFAVAGPWIVAALVSAGVTLLSHKFGYRGALETFRTVLIYNFSFSMVVASPVLVVATRYLAHRLSAQDSKGAPGLLISVLALLYGVMLPLVLGFYMNFTQLDDLIIVGAMVNLFVMTTLWASSLFSLMIEDTSTLVWGYLTGSGVAGVAIWLLLEPYGAAGLLFGLTIGFGVILAILLGQIVAVCDFEFKAPSQFLSAFKAHWPLALGAIFYSAGAWVDKWIMWFSPQADSGGVFSQGYDSALFLCQLTLIPGLVLFFLTVERDFFGAFRRFYEDILGKVPYEKIRQSHQNLRARLAQGGLRAVVLQGCVAALAIGFAPQILDLLGSSPLEVGMFRLGVLGVMFHIMALFIMVVLAYLDARIRPLLIGCVFLATNVAFTEATLELGARFYGYGYFLSSLVTFVVACIILSQVIRNLPYRAIIRYGQSTM